MIKNLTLNDYNQENIINHLETSDKLLQKVASKLSHKEKKQQYMQCQI